MHRVETSRVSVWEPCSFISTAYVYQMESRNSMPRSLARFQSLNRFARMSSLKIQPSCSLTYSLSRNALVTDPMTF